MRTVIARRHVVPTCVLTESVEPRAVYNLTLDRDNAYYANDILVFNCLTFSHPVSPKQRIASGRNLHRAEWDPFAEVNRRPGGSGDYDPFQ